MRRGFTGVAVQSLCILGCLVIFSIFAGAAQDVSAGLKKLHSLTTLPSTAWKYQTGQVTQGERVDLDDHDWPVTKPGAIDQSLMTWVRNTFEVPEFMEGYQIAGARVELSLYVWGRSVAYVNGTRVTSISSERVVVPLTSSAKAGDKFVVAIQLGQESVNGIKLTSADIQVSSAPSRVPPAPALSG